MGSKNGAILKRLREERAADELPGARLKIGFMKGVGCLEPENIKDE